MSNSTDELSTPVVLEGVFPVAGGSTAPQPRKSDPLDRQKAVVAMGRRVITPPDASILMQDAAALLAEVLETEFSAVAELSADGRSPRLRVALRKTGSTEPSTEVHETSAAGTESLAGYALEVAQPVVADDLPRDGRFADALLQKHGIRSAVAVALRLEDRSFGSLAACSTRQRAFDDGDLMFVETIAHLVTTAIARTQAERSLADEHRFVAEVLQTVDALVLVLDRQRQVVRVNSTCERVTGFSLEEIKGRPIWNVFCVPEEVDKFRRLLETLREKAPPIEYESYLLTKHSQRRRVAWSCSAITDDDGTVESIIASGIDITDQRVAEQKAERAIREATKAKEAMARAVPGEQPEKTDEPDSGPSTILSPADARRAFKRLGHLPLGALVERRRHPRRSFPYKQRIAPVVDGKLPDRRAFIDVQCKDIAASGFSFLSPTPPASDTVVVALGIPPKVTYLIARVIHVTRVDHDEQRKFVIGCNYVGRAVYDQATTTRG